MNAKDDFDEVPSVPAETPAEHESMDSLDSQLEPSVEAINPDVNPYAAPIHDHTSVVDVVDAAPGLSPTLDQAEIDRRAQLLLLTGIVLALVLIGLVSIGLMAFAMILSVAQLAWAFSAIRFSSNYGRQASTAVRISFYLTMIFHLIVLALETLAVLFLATCFAVFSSAGN